ncbi:hypothetical protein SADUNF_Sadunf09G0044700 [Salix dunnii]|uniref:Structural constituent of ribosome n=1 Tax=Salix dunnii TaxID=1413687 RepID=A0A835JVL4_9ROSI|nr:hypothetical protein SADUNF_Sadunf09G0044700 [Salix dunnii]
MALFASISTSPLSISTTQIPRPLNFKRRLLCPLATLSPPSPESPPPPPFSSKYHHSSKPLVDSSRPLPDSGFNYAPSNPSANPVVQFIRSTESNIERVKIAKFNSLAGICILSLYNLSFFCLALGIVILVLMVFIVSSISQDSFSSFFRHNQSNSAPLYMPIVIKQAIFDFRFLALLAVVGSLAGSLLCFLNGCVYIIDAYKVYWTSCVKGIHTGKMVLRLVEAIDVYLAGTVMLIFGMGLYGLFICNIPPDAPASADRALKGSSLFGMFALKERPKWMKISSLDELKTKVGHVIVMILLVKMFERSKMVTIATGVDLLSYSVCIFLSSASLYILSNLHKSD